MRIQEPISSSKPLNGRVQNRPCLESPSVGENEKEGKEKCAPSNRTHISFFPLLEETAGTGLIYAPYVYSCPGKSEVTFKGRRERNSGPLFTEVLYDPKKVPKVIGSRTEIKLPGIPKSFVTKARLVAEEIKKEWEIANQLRLDFESAQALYKEELQRAVNPNSGKNGGRTKTRYFQTEEKDGLKKICDAARDACNAHPFGSPYKKIETTNNEKFLEVYNTVLEKLVFGGDVELKYKKDKSFEALVTYLCQKTDKNKKGFLSSVPSNFYSYEDPNLLEKVRTIGRYCLVNLKKNNTAQKIEKYNGFSKDSAGLGVQYLSSILTFSDFLKISFPGYLDGGNPPIREWLVSGTSKWQAEESELYRVKLLATKAVKNVFEEQNVINPNGTINEEKLLEIDWGTTYHHALKGAIGICPFTKTFFDAMELAVPGIFEQIPKFKFKYPGKWTGENGLKTIDDITRYVIERKLKILKSDGSLDIEKAKEVKDWSVQFNDEVTNCVKKSGLKTVHDALARIYPNACGWSVGKLDPADISFSGKWDGDDGKRLFQLKFAKCIYSLFENNKKNRVEGFEEHTVSFNEKSLFPLSVSKADLNLLIGYFMQNGSGWAEFVSDNRLAAGLRDAASGNIETAFKMLFGKESKVNKKLGSSELTLDDLYSRSQNRTSFVSNMIGRIQGEEKIRLFKIDGFGEQRGYRNPDMAVSGIEGTCLESLLDHASPSKIPERTQILYDALAASILPFPTMDEGTSSRVRERNTVLEKILVSVFPEPKTDKPKMLRPVLPEPRLKILLATVRDEIIPNLTITNSLKENLSELITKLIALRNSSVNNCREVLLQACKANDIFELTPVGVLNMTFEKLFESISAYEIRRNKLFGSFSPYFDNIYSTVHEEDADSSEEVVSMSGEEEVEESTPEPEVEMVEVDLNALDEDDDSTPICKVSDEIIKETVEVCSGLKKEDERVQELLVRYLKNGRVPILSALEGGNFPTQMKLLAELRTRINKRSTDRFNFITLRLREPECTNIEMILDKRKSLPNVESKPNDELNVNQVLEDNVIPENSSNPDFIEPLGAELSEEVLAESEKVISDINSESIPVGNEEIDLDKIDKELFGLIPPWWPMNEKEPLAVPLLYWGNILYIALPENRLPNIIKNIQRRFPLAEVKPVIQKTENWNRLAAYFKTNSQIYSRPNATLLRPFISLEDQEILLENSACIRSALVSLLNRRQ